MKTTKKIFVAVLAVMMIALMIPFSASAAETDTYNAFIKGKNGFKVNVYKVATINTTTGEYTEIQGGTAVATALKTWKNASGNDSKALLAACENATFTDADSKGDHTFASDEDVYNFGTDEAGVYYVKVTGQPAETSVKSKGGALFALPEGTKKTQGSAEAPIELKINTGAVNVSKEIVGGDIDNKHTTASAGDTVKFKLTASVTGSKEVPLTEYTIHDNLSDSFRDPAVTEVMVGNTKLQEGTDYTVDKTNLSDIQISLSESYLKAAKEGTNDFYASSDVVVTLTAVLKDTAVSGYNTTNNSNSDSLTYTNTYGQTSKPGDDTVYVYTFDLPVFKYDGTTTDKTGLGNATFVLKKADGTEVATKVTSVEEGSKGKVTFEKLAAGTYTVQETKAPSGYNLNSSEYTVVISTTGVITVSVDGNSSEVNQVEVPDYPVTVPSTGGMGTMMFYVGGAALIACAGVLLFVLKRKKAAK
nr:SpaH/EbpB family LPXTG-anchored major pilin [Ruminococcus bromii]